MPDTTVTRRRALRTLGAIAAAPAVLRGQSRPPNLVFLLGDDHRWDALGAMGNRIIQTPHIDRLAARGITFTNCFVTTSICVVSRASIFTGLYARSHGILRFQDEFPARRFAQSYPALLHQAGYRNGFIGKWGIDGGKMPVEYFDYFRGFQGQGHYFPDAHNPRRHLTAVMGDQALEFLAGCRPQQPFSLSVSFKAPHVQDEDPRQFLYDPQDEALYRDISVPEPVTAALRYIQQLPLAVQRSEARRRWAVRFATPALFQQSVKGYYRLITGIDREVGHIVQALEKRGLAENTVIVYSGDNGFYLGEHGLAGKWFPHEESIRVPLMVADLRRRQAARRLPQLALNIDIAPTLLALAGVAAPPSMQGRSLVPLWEGRETPWRQDFFYEHLFENAWIPRTEAVRTQRWKYTRYVDENPLFEELFDLSIDSMEQHNLSAAPAQQDWMASLRGRHAMWLAHLERWRDDAPWSEPPADQVE